MIKWRIVRDKTNTNCSLIMAEKILLIIFLIFANIEVSSSAAVNCTNECLSGDQRASLISQIFQTFQEALRILASCFTNGSQEYPSLASSTTTEVTTTTTERAATTAKTTTTTPAAATTTTPLRRIRFYNQTRTQYINTVDISCSPGYSLLSCGNANGNKWVSDDFGYFTPINSTSCRCKNNKETSTCLAWCTSGVVDGFQIVSSDTFLTGTFQSSCPNGKNVIDCHRVPDQSTTTFEHFPRYYPSSNTTCTCSDAYGAKCVATCAANVAEYGIKQVTGSGTFQVACPAPSVALGCGISPTGDGSWEAYRTVSVVNQNACQCYDFYGATCYAICGQI